MTPVFDRIVIAVPDLSGAIAEYQQLLGASPWETLSDEGEPCAWWALANTVIELVQRDVQDPAVHGFVMTDNIGGQADEQVSNSLGLEVSRCDGKRTALFREQHPESECGNLLVDHVVLRTSDADACITLFKEQMGIRLALDKNEPQWGGRMLFFRTGKLTLEVIQGEDTSGGENFFWGIAYRCPALAPVQAELLARNVVVSDVREGRKPGTHVATVKSHCLNIPTLLIEPAV
jgi:catechol 2,3-dioxygenase-like lactoylglutathione lyase family enzyme